MNTNELLKNKWTWVVGGIILLIIIMISGGENKSISTTSQSQVENTQQGTQSKELTLEQKSIQEFLAKEIKLDDKLQRGNDEVANAGREFDYGVPFPYMIKAELIFEDVIEESKALVAPSSAEKVKTYFIEAATNAYSGVKKMREGLESYPVDKTKLEQGLEIYNKTQMSLAKKNAEINKLKQEAGL